MATPAARGSGRRESRFAYFCVVPALRIALRRSGCPPRGRRRTASCRTAPGPAASIPTSIVNSKSAVPRADSGSPEPGECRSRPGSPWRRPCTPSWSPRCTARPRRAVLPTGSRIRVVPVSRRQVLAHEDLESGAAARQLAELRRLPTELVPDDRRDEVVLGVEMGVEGSVGEPGIGHQRCNAGPVDPVLLEAAAGGIDDPLPGRLLVLLAVSGHRFLQFSGACHYDQHTLCSDEHNIMIDRQTAEGVHHEAEQPVALVTGASPSATTRRVDLTAGTIPDAQTVFAQVLVTVETRANGGSSGRLPANLQPPSRGRPSGNV